MFQWTGIDRSRVSVIYDPGLDFSEFHPDVDGTSVRKEFGLGEDDFLVTLVAKLAERKGHETLIRAAPKVLASLPNTYFLLVGGELPGDHHEEYARYLKSLPRSLGVVDRVIFTGFRPDVPEVMAASDIIVHCSVYPDPFPGVVLQGMAVGKSVIASDIGGPREQIEDRVSGVLVEPGNSTALGQAVCSLLHDEKKREALGKAAVERVQALFGAESYSKKISNLYESVISQSR
jgi:glycosyltransferase involved in cell wall biosynthesis